MLTAQCYRLRKRAMELRQGRWSDGADDARLMEESADIIENLRLRLTDITVHDERVDRLKAENAKLRELVRDMWHDGMCDCDEQYTCAECCEYHYHERMRELEIEVDE